MHGIVSAAKAKGAGIVPGSCEEWADDIPKRDPIGGVETAACRMLWSCPLSTCLGLPSTLCGE